MNFYPRLAIIIPTKNEQNYLPNLLESIKQQSYKNYFIIVADAQSTDQTVSIATNYGATVVPGGMPFTGRNNGADYAIDHGADLLIFIDADIILPNPFFLEKTINEFYSKNLDLAGTLQKPYQFRNGKIVVSRNLWYRAIYGTANLGMLLLQHSKRPMFQVCMYVKPQVHQAIGGFKPLEYGEDSQYAQDAVKLGFKFGILTSAGKVLISPRRYENKGFFGSGVIYFLSGMLLGKKFEYGKTKRKYFD